MFNFLAHILEHRIFHCEHYLLSLRTSFYQ